MCSEASKPPIGGEGNAFHAAIAPNRATSPHVTSRSTEARSISTDPRGVENSAFRASTPASLALSTLYAPAMPESAPHVCFVVGARPNFMKAAPVHRALQQAGIEVTLVHTGQHYDPE